MKPSQTFVLASFFMAFSANAQFIQQDSVSLSPVNELQRDSVAVWMSNPTSQSTEILDVWTMPLYGNTLATVRVPNAVIPSGDSVQVWVAFTPEHNVMHKLPILFHLSDERGYELLTLKVQGQWSRSYYQSTENKVQSALRGALTTRLGQGYNSLSYSIARDNMYGTLDNHNGQVECVYTGRSATFNTRAGANANNINCEHTFPQSKFNSAQPMKSDIHHLFPCDASANSSRSNHPFGIVTGTPAWSNGGSKRLGSIWEPRDVHKGDAARAMLYFVARYGDYSNFFVGQETLLRQWHVQYPPDSLDRLRNDGIYSLQNNRNPFVDYPQITERVSQWAGNWAVTTTWDSHRSEDTLRFALRGSGYGERKFMVVNSGTETIYLSNLALSHSSISLSNPSNVTIEPGHSHMVTLTYDATMNFTGETLSYLESTASGFNQVTIHVNSSNSFSIDEPQVTSELLVLPSAGKVLVYPIEEGSQVELLAIDGRVLQSLRATEDASKAQPMHIQVNSQLAGIVRVTHGSDVQITKFIFTL